MNVVKYFEEGGETRRIVEHYSKKRKFKGKNRSEYDWVTDRKWLTIERFDGRNWVEVTELGEYVEPEDAP